MFISCFFKKECEWLYEAKIPGVLLDVKGDGNFHFYCMFNYLFQRQYLPKNKWNEQDQYYYVDAKGNIQWGSRFFGRGGLVGAITFFL